MELKILLDHAYLRNLILYPSTEAVLGMERVTYNHILFRFGSRNPLSDTRFATARCKIENNTSQPILIINITVKLVIFSIFVMNLFCIKMGYFL